MWRVLGSRVVLALAGWALIGFSITVAGVWFFWLLPRAQRSDPGWYEQFSRRAYWQKLERSIHRHGWVHDDFSPVGHYGDKGWAQWIMSKAEAGDPIANCGDIGHKDTALKFITCNDPTHGTNWNTEQQWLAWWRTNRDVSQLDWIRGGLEKYGVSVHTPPTEADWEPLLALLGNGSTNAGEKIPGFVKYNAFRWLRDGGFEVLPFALSNITVKTPPLVRAGILEYGKYDRFWPKEDEIGRLTFGESPSQSDSHVRLIFFRPGIQISGYGLMTIPFAAGVVFLVCSRRKRQKVEQAASPNGGSAARPGNSGAGGGSPSVS